MEAESSWVYDVAVSVIQIYNESVDDLLVTKKGGGADAAKAGTDLKIRQQGDGSFEVEGLTRAPCKTRRELLSRIAQVTPGSGPRLHPHGHCCIPFLFSPLA